MVVYKSAGRDSLCAATLPVRAGASAAGASAAGVSGPGGGGGAGRASVCRGRRTCCVYSGRAPASASGGIERTRSRSARVCPHTATGAHRTRSPATTYNYRRYNFLSASLRHFVRRDSHSHCFLANESLEFCVRVRLCGRCFL